jgi:hypothetical protein
MEDGLRTIEPDIEEHGTCVFLTNTIRTEDLEPWVRKVAALSEQRVGWYWLAARAHVIALGDLNRVRAAIWLLKDEHDRLYEAEIRRMCAGTSISEAMIQQSIGYGRDLKPF